MAKAAETTVNLPVKAAKRPKVRRRGGPFRKVVSFAFYSIAVLLILAGALIYLPQRQALFTAAAVFLMAACVIVHISLSSKQKNRIKFAPYHQISFKVFSPFALLFSFVVICYLLNLTEPTLFVGSKKATLADFSVFAFDNILRVVFWDVPEIYGLSATRITHNVDNLMISTLVFLFRALIGLSLIRMVVVLLRN